MTSELMELLSHNQEKKRYYYNNGFIQQHYYSNPVGYYGNNSSNVPFIPVSAVPMNTFVPQVQTNAFGISDDPSSSSSTFTPMNNTAFSANNSNKKAKRNYEKDDEDDEDDEDEVHREVMRKKIRTDFKELDAYTIKLMLDTGCILWGRGKRYERKLFEAWDESTILQYKMYKKTNQKDILDHYCRDRIETIKTEQFFVFAQHYQNLPLELKNIINYAYPDFRIELDKIINQAQDATYFGVILLEIWSDLIKD